MRTPVAVVLSAALLPLALPAQGPPGPAKELKKLEKLVGTWEGSGTATMAPGMPAGDWTSKHSYRWILGGHFLREDARIDLGGGMGHMAFVGFMGYDRESKRFVSLGVGNDGKINVADVHWTANGTMVQASQGIEQGELVVDRWVTELGDGAMTFHSQRTIGDGEPFVFVEGTSRRISEKPSDIDLGNEVAMMTDTSKMKRLAGACGKYAVKGWMIGGPGEPKIEISGTDITDLILGGSILRTRVAGDPTPEWPGPAYESLGFMAWDSANQRYKTFNLSNMGEIHQSDGFWVGANMVMAGQTMRAGMPVLGRTVMHLDEGGVINTVTADMITGTAEPFRTFEATYEKKQ